MANKKEDIVAGLELALSVVIPASQNKWVSVKELSVVKVLQEASVNKNYSAVFMDVLKEHGLMEVTGNRGGMMFRFNSELIPDYGKLATEMYFKYHSHLAQRTKPSDFKPLYRKAKTIEEKPGKCIVTRRKLILPNIGDTVYLMYENSIRQAVVLGTSIDICTSAPTQPGRKQVSIDVLIPLKRYANQTEVFKENDKVNHPFIARLDVDAREVFNSLEDLTDYLIRRTYRFPKDYLRFYGND